MQKYTTLPEFSHLLGLGYAMNLNFFRNIYVAPNISRIMIGSQA
jgi:hypothetical protein